MGWGRAVRRCAHYAIDHVYAGALLVCSGTMCSNNTLKRCRQVPTRRTRTKVTKAGRRRRSPNLRRSKVPLSRRFLLNPCSPSFALLPSQCERRPRFGNRMQRRDLARSRKCHLTLDSRCIDSMFQVSMGRPAPSSAEAGKLVRRRTTKLRRSEVHRATVACFCDDCARGVVAIRHLRFHKRGRLFAPECG